MNTITTRIDLSEREHLERMLAKAHAEGVRILVDDDGRHYATSSSDPKALLYVTGHSCDCAGFIHHGRCKHHAALLEYQGWLGTPAPQDPTPTALPVPTAVCETCNGAGLEVESHSRWVGGRRLGFRDTWTTLTPCRACEGPVIDPGADAEFRDQAWEVTHLLAA